MTTLERKYISVDIEASGLTPGKYSMLSLGSCLVEDTSVNFYREIKPINNNFDYCAMQVAANGLECLKGLKIDELNPHSKKFRPRRVLDVLREKGDEPKIVMSDYAEWINKNTVGFRLCKWLLR